MKQFLSNSFFSVLYRFISLRMSYYQWRNRKKDRLLIYTDSRGHEITHLYNKQNPFSAYSKYFIQHWKTDVLTVPERHTTFYDFLDYVENSKVEYTHIIAHVGVVCFAPRPISQMDATLKLKQQKIENLFGKDVYQRLVGFEGYDTTYRNERTSSLVPDFMLPLIAEKLNAIPNLVWINCNGVAEGWVGNYKERPDNLDIVRDKSLTLMEMLKTDKIVDLTGWTDDEIKRYTCDNVHLTKEGMDYLRDQVKVLIEK